MKEAKGDYMNDRNKQIVKIVEAMDLIGNIVESVEPEFAGELRQDCYKTGRILIAIRPDKKD